MADNGASSYRRFLQGDKRALEELVETYSDELIRYAYCFVQDSAAAEDIMEDTFAALIVKRRKFTEKFSFKSYLYRIVHNKSIDYLRANKKRAEMKEAEKLPYGDFEEEIFVRERNHALQRCLKRLPEQYRAAIHLVYLDGFSVEQARGVLGKSRKQMYNLLNRAKANLKTLLEEDGYVENL